MLTISRVLYRFSEPATAIHLDLQLPAGSSNQPESYPNPVNASLFGLAPSEVYLAPYVTIRAVRSYRTFSALPVLSYWRIIFCCTICRVTPPCR